MRERAAADSYSLRARVTSLRASGLQQDPNERKRTACMRRRGGKLAFASELRILYSALMDEELKTARAVLDLLSSEAAKAEAVLMSIASKLKDEGLALAVVSQARALRLAAEESTKLVELLRERS
jgi:hypothetical protein